MMIIRMLTLTTSMISISNLILYSLIEPILYYSIYPILRDYILMKAEELKEKGNQLFKTGEYETAIRYYSEAIVNLN
jgi:hypothetical protein